MPIIWKTKNINIQKYYNIIRNTIMLNSDSGDGYNSYQTWLKFKKECKLTILPADKIEENRRYFAHLNVETSTGIAWGVTGKDEITMFINDSRNPFIIRSNAMPLAHELLHWIYQKAVGTSHIRRKYDAPEGKAGGMGPMSTVIVHDNYYGTKKTLKFWISWGLGWIPINIPYIPIKEAIKKYSLSSDTSVIN